jgi:DNA-binding response OmpR family regulator
MGDSSSRKKILIVDDEPDITTILKMGLEQAGYSVTTFNDPERALMYFEPKKYDLLLIDIRMPKMNGFELYRAIIKKDANVKVCFITAFEIYDYEFKRVFPSYMIHCFIKKPITIKDLVSIVREQIGA